MKNMLPMLVVLSLVVISGCNPCADHMDSEVFSPGKSLAATSFTRNCGATTDYSTIVSLHRPDDGYDGEAKIVFVAKGERLIRLSWIGPRQLKIACSGCPRESIFRQVAVVGDVDINYDLNASDSNTKSSADQAVFR